MGEILVRLSDSDLVGQIEKLARQRNVSPESEATDPEVLRNVISVCWYGRPLVPDSYKQMHHDSGELTNDPERHAFYIASLLPYFKGGIKRLKALN